MTRATTTNRRLLGLLLTVVATAGTLAACGDDKDGGSRGEAAGGSGDLGAGQPADPGSDGGGAPTADLDVCTLLEPSDIEARWPGLGPVEDGEPLDPTCTWFFGEDGEMSITVQNVGHAPGLDAEGTMGLHRSQWTDAVDVDAGDEAFITGPEGHTVYARRGVNVLSVSAMGPDHVVGAPIDEVTALADLVADRFPEEYVGG